MAKFVQVYWKLFFIFILLWSLLHESFAPSVLASGALASFVSVYASDRLFFKSFDLSIYHLPLKKALPFLLRLFIDIYASTFSLVKAMLQGKLRPEVVRIHTRVANPWHQCLVSNAITMTPGTVTINKSGKELTVLWLTPETEDAAEQAAMIQGSFEKVLTKGEADT